QRGKYLLALSTPKGWRHLEYANIADLAANAQRASSDPRVSVYYALSGFKSSVRRQGDVVAVGSFWLDIDCGPDKAYETQAAGAAAFIAFKKEVGLPSPMIVNSGNGLHVYWPLDHDLDPDAWKSTATLLKAACIKFGLKVDHSRTTDSASVLRPAGSINRKNGAAKPVVVLN